jgi:hypothetical protein
VAPAAPLSWATCKVVGAKLSSVREMKLHTNTLAGRCIMSSNSFVLKFVLTLQPNEEETVTRDDNGSGSDWVE